MKELSIEEKAKAYDEIIKKANKMHSENCEDCQICIEELIPELKESKDERIRKALISILKSDFEKDTTIFDISVKEIIDWLEKQGEQKSFARYKVGDTIYYNSFGRLVSFTIANIVEDGTDNPMYEDKDGNSVFQNDIVEQKPAETTDLRTWKYIVDTVLTEREGIGQYIDSPFTEEVAKKLQKIFGNIEQKPAWSEEDKKIISAIITDVKYVQLHHKDFEIYEEEINWLKSLKGRYTWKPSDEQMDAFEYCVENNCCDKDGYNGGIMVELLEQLKKLREE